MANTNNCLGISNPNGETFVDYHTDPVGANNAFSAGVTSGFNVRENDPAGMTVLVGGELGVQDSAIVKSTSGIVYPVGNTTGDAIEITVSGAPVTNSRIDVIVLSVDTISTTSELNGYDLVSVDIVEGTASSSPTAPTDADIETEIGAGKAFIRLAEIRVESGVVVIVNSDITSDRFAKVGSQNIDFTTYVKFIKHTGNAVTLPNEYNNFIINVIAASPAQSTNGGIGVAITGTTNYWRTRLLTLSENTIESNEGNYPQLVVSASATHITKNSAELMVTANLNVASNGRVYANGLSRVGGRMCSGLFTFEASKSGTIGLNTYRDNGSISQTEWFIECRKF